MENLEKIIADSLVILCIIVIIGVVGMAVSLVFGVGSPLVNIHQGDNGIGYNVVSGNQNDKLYTPGITPIFPWTIVHEFHTVAKQTPESSKNDFPTSDGGKINVVSTLTYQIKPDVNILGRLWTTYQGEEYNRLIKPAWQTSMGANIAERPTSYFSSKRDMYELGAEIKTELNAKLNADGVLIEDVYIEVATPPEGVANAVDMRQELNASNNNSDMVVGYKRAKEMGKTQNKVIVT